MIGHSKVRCVELRAAKNQAEEMKKAKGVNPATAKEPRVVITSNEVPPLPSRAGPRVREA